MTREMREEVSQRFSSSTPSKNSSASVGFPGTSNPDVTPGTPLGDEVGVELRRRRVLAVLAKGEHLSLRAIAERVGVSHQSVKRHLGWLESHGYVLRTADDHTVGQRGNAKGRCLRTPRYVVTDLGHSWLGGMAPDWFQEMDEATQEYERLTLKLAKWEARDRRRCWAERRAQERADAAAVSVPLEASV